MQIKLGTQEGTVNLSPTTSEEEGFVNRIANEIKNGDLLEYAGRGGAEHGTPYSERMHLFFKLDGDKIKLIASSDEDEPIIRGLRDAIYFGGGGLRMINVQINADTGKNSLDMCVEFCQHCRAPMIQMGRVEHETCEACVAKCEHVYINGFMHGGIAGQLSEGLFCEKCGRGKPDKEPNVIVPNRPCPGEIFFVAL